MYNDEMGIGTIYKQRRRQLGCECSEELYLLVRERAVITGDSMAGVLRAAIVEYLKNKPDLLSTLNGGATRNDSRASAGAD